MLESSEEFVTSQEMDAKPEHESDTGSANIQNPIKEKIEPLASAQPKGDNLVVADSVKLPVKSDSVVVKDGAKTTKSGSVGQLEELENLTGLSGKEICQFIGILH